jgi:Domain of unknown function (DUF4382)
MDRATRKMVYFAIVGLLLAGSMIAVFQTSPVLAKDGTVSIYMSSIQSDINVQPATTGSSQSASAQISGKPTVTLLSLNVTIDSVTIYRNDNGSAVTSNVKFTFDVLKPFNVSTLILSTKVPAENVTVVALHVSSATAAVQGSTALQTVKVPSGELKIPVQPALQVKAQTSSSILISGTAHIVFTGNKQIILTPVLHAQKMTGP